MPSLKNTVSHSNIFEFPTVFLSPELPDSMTIGDLHGNFLKLIYILIEAGIIQGIGKKEYKKLIGIAEQFQKIFQILLVEEDVYSLKKLQKHLSKTFAQLTCNSKLPKDFTLFLIGDVLSDRMYDDGFMLELLKRLDEIGIHTQICYSNHDALFLEWFFLKKQNPDYCFEQQMGPDQQRSLVNLITRLNADLISWSTIQDLVENHYLKKLTLFAYSDVKSMLNGVPIGNTDFIIRTHAPQIDIFKSIQQFAFYFPPKYLTKAQNIEMLCRFLGEINQVFQKKLENNGKEYFEDMKNSKCYAAYQAVSNNRDPGCHMAKLGNDISIINVYGHVGPTACSKKYPYNLDDSYFGRSENFETVSVFLTFASLTQYSSYSQQRQTIADAAINKRQLELEKYILSCLNVEDHEKKHQRNLIKIINEEVDKYFLVRMDEKTDQGLLYLAILNNHSKKVIEVLCQKGARIDSYQQGHSYWESSKIIHQPNSMGLISVFDSVLFLDSKELPENNLKILKHNLARMQPEEAHALLAIKCTPLFKLHAYFVEELFTIYWKYKINNKKESFALSDMVIAISTVKDVDEILPIVNDCKVAVSRGCFRSDFFSVCSNVFLNQRLGNILSHLPNVTDKPSQYLDENLADAPNNSMFYFKVTSV